MSQHWLYHALWCAIGILIGAVMVSWFVIIVAARGVRVAKRARQERDAITQELQRILAARRSQCFEAYTNGVAMGLEARSRQYELGAVDALVGAETYQEEHE